MRNPRPASDQSGISPQFYPDTARTRENLEARSQVEDLKRKNQPSSDTPADTKLYRYRDEGIGGRYAIGSVSRTSGQPDLEIPGSGFKLPQIYKGERLAVEVLIGAMTVTGSTHVQIDLLGKVDQSATETLIGTSKEAPPALPTAAPYFTYLIGEMPSSFREGRVRILVGSEGGTIAVNAGAALRQHWTLYVPVGT